MSQALRKFEKYVERLQEAANASTIQHLKPIGEYGFECAGLTSDKPNIYMPSPTAIKFHSTVDFVRMLIGPYGSGKTTMALAEIVHHVRHMPKCTDGIRRGRYYFIRNTYNELEGTTLKSWDDWFGNLGEVTKTKKPMYRFHRFNDGEGIVELEIEFLALDRPGSENKLQSREYTGAYVNECQHIPRSIFTHIKSRAGRYPSAKMLGVKPGELEIDIHISNQMSASEFAEWQQEQLFQKIIIADTNPPDTDHWIYEMFEVQKPPKHHLFKQPPAVLETDAGWVINPEAENIKYLPANYYQDMMLGESREFIKVYCCGEYGSVIDGKPVYPNYNDDVHAVDNIDPIAALPLHLGWDFGFTPACVILQQNTRGQLYLVKELVAEDMGIRNFAENVVLPCLNTEFAGFEVGLSVGDPAGNTRLGTDVNDTDTSIRILNDLGIPTFGCDTNSPIARTDAVGAFLDRLIDGKPGLILSKERCKTLRKGFIGGYQFERVRVMGETMFKDKPRKDMYSHIHDALQYICYELNNHSSKPKDLDLSAFRSPVTCGY